MGPHAFRPTRSGCRASAPHRAEKNHRAVGAVYRCGRVLARAAPRRRRRPRRGRDGLARQHL